MSLHVYLLPGLAVVLIALALWMLAKYQPSSSIRYYAGFLLGLGALAAVSGLVYVDFSISTLLILTRVGYLAGVLTFAMLLMFSWYYPVPSAKMPRRPELFWLLPLAFFIPFILFSSSFLANVEVTTGSPLEVQGMGFWAFPAFVVIYAILAFKNFWQKMHFVQGQAQKNTRVFLWSLVVATVSGVVFDVLLPATGRPRVPVGVYSSAVLFGITAYIVVRK